MTTYFYDTDNDGRTPLTIVESEDKGYASGEAYTDGTDFDFGFNSRTEWTGPCVYLKTSVSYAPRESECDREISYFCRWNSELTLIHSH